MKIRAFVTILSLAAALVATKPIAAQAQEPRAEVGASLAGLVVGLGDNEGSTFGIPAGGFGILNPGVYASLFLGEHVAIEPQVGLFWASFGGDSEHIVNLVGQVDYFISGITQPSVYLFAAGGLVSSSGPGTTPKSVGGGLGYRMPLGDRLTFRLDGRVTHLTDNGGNMMAFTFSLGGLFGQR